MNDALQRPEQPASIPAVELRSVAELLPAVIAEMKRPRLAVRADGGFDIFDPDHPGFTYEIDDEILRDARSAFEWVRQLAEKRWVSKQTLLDLANAVIAHQDVAARKPVT